MKAHHQHLVAALAAWQDAEYDGPETRVPSWVGEVTEELEPLVAPGLHPICGIETLQILVGEEIDRQRAERKAAV